MIRSYADSGRFEVNSLSHRTPMVAAHVIQINLKFYGLALSSDAQLADVGGIEGESHVARNADPPRLIADRGSVRRARRFPRGVQLFIA